MLSIHPIPQTNHLLALAGHMASLCLALAGIWTLADTEGSSLAPLLARLALIIILTFFAATRLRALGNVQHETCHNLFVLNSKHNRRLGRLIGIVLFQPHESYVFDHMSHHRWLGKGSLDRDLARYEGSLPGQGTPNGLWPQWRLAATWPCFRVALRFRVWCARDPWFCNVARCLWLGCILAALVYLILKGYLLAASSSVLSVGVIYPFLCVWSDIADHVLHGRMESRPGQVLKHARNHIFAWGPLNLLLQPRCDGYHLVHHLRPNIPVSALAQEHAKLCRRYPAYARLEHTLNLGRGTQPETTSTRS